MDDRAYVDQLLAILTNPDPQGIDPDDPYGQAIDGIDRYDGFGRDVWVESLKVVDGDHGAELEVGFALAVPDDPAFATVPRQGTTRVPFEAEWRRLSGYEHPAGYAPAIARRVQSSAGNLARQHRGGADWAAAKDRVRAQLPSRSDQWRMLLDDLSAEGTVSEPAPGRITVDLPPERVFAGGSNQITVLVTPDQWEGVLVRFDGKFDDIWELFGSRWSPEYTYLVCWEADLEWSIREELPPLHCSDIADMARRIAAHTQQ